MMVALKGDFLPFLLGNEPNSYKYLNASWPVSPYPITKELNGEETVQSVVSISTKFTGW